MEQHGSGSDRRLSSGGHDTGTVTSEDIDTEYVQTMEDTEDEATEYVQTMEDIEEENTDHVQIMEDKEEETTEYVQKMDDKENEAAEYIQTLEDKEEETRLYEIYLTHHSIMDGTTKLKKHDSLQKQISAYEKLLQHCMNKFSKDKLYQMLKLASHGIPPLKGPGTIKSLKVQQISTMTELRDIVDNFSDGTKKGLAKEEETHMIKYFNTFFNDLEYLEEMKQYFDERIYMCLYEYYYDPMEDRGNVHIEPDEELDIEGMDESDKLAYAVRKLYHLNKFWDKMFTQGQFEVKYFDPDSFHELIKFENITDFEAILRLVPDIFVKSYKSVELAKLWWTQANKIYPELPLKRNTTKSFQKLAESLEERIVQLDNDIDKEEELLMVHEEDLRVLEGRESRFSDLSESCEGIEYKRNELGRQYNEFLMQQKSLTEEVEHSKKGTSKYRRIKSALDKLTQQIPTTSEELKLLSYNYDILQEDFEIEMEVRPTLIRYVERVREKVLALEESIRSKLTSKRSAEKQLELLRTNTERMREILRKHIQGATRSETKHPRSFRVLPPKKEENVENTKDLNGNITDNAGNKNSNKKSEFQKQEVHYDEEAEVYTYSADDETDEETRKPRNCGRDSPYVHKKIDALTIFKESQKEQQKHTNKNDNVKSEPSGQRHQSQKAVSMIQESKIPYERDKHQKKKIPVYNSPNSKGTSKSKTNIPRKESIVHVEPHLTPRDGKTNKPIRNKDPALIQLKPETRKTSPDSGLGTDKSSPQRTSDDGATRRKPKRPSRLPQPQPALRPIPN